jgi:deazaflavin-dependent oxidoreductase (nitroreductase family)
VLQRTIRELVDETSQRALLDHVQQLEAHLVIVDVLDHVPHAVHKVLAKSGRLTEELVVGPGDLRVPHARVMAAAPTIDSLTRINGKDGDMPLRGDYEPSTAGWVREQVENYERSNGVEANTLRDTGLAIVIVTTRGNRTGKLRKTPLMRVEHEGQYALVASQGGAPKHPVWYFNLKADPEAVTVQDGPEPFDFSVHEPTGAERTQWWERAVAAFPPYAAYQTKTKRLIPLFVATRRD